MHSQIILVLIYNCICCHRMQSACTSVCIQWLPSQRYFSTVLTSALNEDTLYMVSSKCLNLWSYMYRYVAYRHYKLSVECENAQNTDQLHALVDSNPI